MNQLRSLERQIGFFETAWLCVLLWCPAAVLALLFPDGNPTAAFFWVLGTAVPVTALRLICLGRWGVWQKRGLCLALTGLCLLLLPTGMKRAYYGLCCALCLLSGLVLPWPHGKMTLTVPKLWHGLLPLMAYALGRVAGAELLCIGAILFAALMALLYALHRNSVRLLSTLREEADAQVSVGGILRLNRRTMALFLALGTAALITLPLLRQAPEQTPPVYEMIPAPETTASATEPTEPVQNPIVLEDSTAEPFDLTALDRGFTWLVVCFAACAVGMAVFAVVLALSSLDRSKRRHRELAQAELVIEPLPQTAAKNEPLFAAPGRRARGLRRRYARLIRRRAPASAELGSMTPTQLEQAASLSGPGAAAIHALYARVRYGPEPATKEDEQAFQAALRQLEEPNP